MEGNTVNKPQENGNRLLPYHMGVFDHSSMRVEVWKDVERDLWIE